jgi:hypothetical protein
MTTLLSLLLAATPALAQVPVASPDVKASTTAERQGGNFGLGFAIGAPSGLAGKIWMNPNNGIQFSVGGDLGRVGDLVATVDYTRHFRPFATEDDIYSVPLHFGFGVNLGSNVFELNNTVLLGPRFVAGATVNITELPIDLYFETAPTLYVYESLTWSIDGQLGVRYYF